MDSLSQKLQLDECLSWIIENNFKRVVVQFKREHLKHAADVTAYLQQKFCERCPTIEYPLDLYSTLANTCCVDLLVTQHVSNVDAIIHIGNVCLSKPHIKKRQCVEQPLMLAFGAPSVSQDKFEANVDRVLREIERIKREDKNSTICLLYDTSMIEYAIKLEEEIRDAQIEEVDIADLSSPAANWTTPPRFRSKLTANPGPDLHKFGQHLLKRPISDYTCAIHLGHRLSIQSILSGPTKFLKVIVEPDFSVEKVNTTKALNKRMALVGRLKDQDELRIGVIITNPLPDLDEISPRLKTYAEARNHMLYYITMVQTIDECKIGNFDLCDAFIVINSCNCSTILESLVFNRPIITELEFKLVCGFEAEYGRVLWPGSTSHLSEDDMINKRKVSDVALALIHTRNELLERCSQARANKWSGLDYGPSSKGSTGDCRESGESLTIEDGLTGIASTYSSEPLKKDQPNCEDSSCKDES